MILAMFDELGRVERVLNTSILVNTDLVQTYRTTLFVMMFVDYLFDSLLSDADHFFCGVAVSDWLTSIVVLR